MRLSRRLSGLFLQLIGLVTVLGIIGILIVLPLLPRLLQVEDPVTKADMIVPLAGEWHRLIKAAELYKAGVAPKVVLSNSRIRPPSRIDKIREDMGLPRTPPREFRHRLMIHLGVPADAMADFGNGHISTSEEAEAFRAFIKKNATSEQATQPLRVILVTSPYHTRRARLTFRDAMPDIRFSVTAPPERRLEPQWWKDRDSAVLSVLESFKFMHYLLGGRFRAQAAGQ